MKDHFKALVLAVAFGGALAGLAIPAQAAVHVTRAQIEQKRTADARYNIQSTLQTNPDLNGTLVNAYVTNHYVRLTGDVDSQQDLNQVLHIARSYAGHRPVVNDINMGGNLLE